MKKKKIYISGKITGMEDEATKLFEKAEKKLQNDGYEVVNPMTIDHAGNELWEDYMKTRIIALMECDCIYMLNNWRDSKGAALELYNAENLYMDVIFQSRDRIRKAKAKAKPVLYENLDS